jgi:F-type H+-transporting ATPase subunit b
LAFHVGNFLITIISFGILFLLLRKYAFGPLIGIMAKRQEEIERQINEAAARSQEAERLLAEQKQLLQQAREEARQIVERARVTGEKQAEEIINQAKEEADRQRQQALLEIQREKEVALAAMREQLSVLSVQIAAKIIEKEIDPQAQKELVDSFVGQVGKVQ